MDNSFTEHVLERARQRQKKLAPLREANFISTSAPNVTQTEVIKNRKDIVSDSILLAPQLMKCNSKTKISSNISGSPSKEFNTLNIQKDNLNMEIRFSSAENVRLEVEIQSEEEDTSASDPCIHEVKKIEEPAADAEEVPALRQEAKTRLQRLGKLYSDSEDLSSPISRTEAKFQIEDNATSESKENDKQAVAADKTKARKGLSKLIDLANNINEWEDDFTSSRKNMAEKKLTASKRWKAPAPQPPTQKESPTKKTHGKSQAPPPPKVIFSSPKPQQPDREAADSSPSAAKQLKWDKTVLDTLESQGFTRTESNSRLVYKFQKDTNKQDTVEEECEAVVESPTKPVIKAKPSAPPAETHVEENLVTPRSPVKSRAIASRAAMFEHASPKKEKDPALLSVSERKALFEKNRGEALLPKAAFGMAAPIAKKEVKPSTSTVEMSKFEVVGKSKVGSIAEKIAQLNQDANTSTIASKQIDDKIKQEREKEMEVLMNRFNKNKKVTIKNVDIIETDPDESDEHESDDEEMCVSETTAMITKSPVKVIRKSTEMLPQPKESRKSGEKRSKSGDSPQVQAVLGDVKRIKVTQPRDGKLYPCLSDIEATTETEPDATASSQNNSSLDDSDESDSGDDQWQFVKTPRPIDSSLPTHVVEGSEVLPLQYTVSFYRKQQSQSSTPVRQVIRPTPEDDNNSITDDEINNSEVQRKIDYLTREVNKQQLVISQASSALNLCISTPEFTGSTEQVEAERLLLLASHRRQAAALEIQRLKVERNIRPSSQHAQNIPVEKGTLVISNITLPLKKEYTKALAAAGGKGHHVICLIKCGEQIAETQLVSTVASTSKNLNVELTIPGSVKLQNVYSDFTVTVEVYCLQAQEEILPHEVKYHIGKKSSRLTPRKGKQENRMLRPPKESPGGPQAVRTSSFALNGYVIFSIQAINKTQWTLNQTPPISPLDGSLHMRVHCEFDVSVEHRAFLNMFEDVSGWGAWHRRWCVLKGNTISYWKYPEDETKKAPIDTIDLRSCITTTVGPVSREICARLHTFLLERERPAMSNDRETLTISCHGNKTIIKHLLSADTKEERIDWCTKMNKSLAALRMCGAVRSTDV